jgi:hypothetical protein
MPSTTNFGWTTPADTDLVKDGALAIRTLGNGVDTSLVDLKGGTTGQALTKATNTDLDYSWTDIIPASATFFAGKNKIINGDFGIWQRGTSFSNPSTGAYTADRWNVQHDGTGATRTVSQQTFTPGTAPVSGYEGTTFFRYEVSGGTGNTFQQTGQKIENVRTFAGQTVTLSFWAKADATRAVEFLVRRDFGSGGSAADQSSVASINATTSWARYTITANFGSVSGKTIGTGSSVEVILRFPAATAVTIDLWGVQLESGSTATAFQTASGTIQGELALCQRYYYRITPGSANRFLANAQIGSTTGGNVTGNFPVTMRTRPTALEQNGTANNYAFFTQATTTVCNGVPTYSALTTADSFRLTATVASGLTAGDAGILFTDPTNGATAYLGWSAEL